MFKLTFCLRRKPHLSREEFQTYWRDTHGPLVRSVAGALAIKRYVQFHTALDPVNDFIRERRGAPEPFDGVAELWFESREAWEAATRSPEGKAANKTLWEDEANFIDSVHSPVWVGEEHTIIEG